MIGRGLGSLLPLASLAACVGAAPTGGNGDAPRRRPNLVVFMVDDLGWQDVSLPLHHEPTRLNARYRTPNVERLAARGVRFTDAYASAPVCSPTRTSLMTGRSPAATGITWWVLWPDRHTSREHPTLEPPHWRVNGLQAGDLTLAGLLQSAGYRTIHVGKAHLGAKGTSGEDPRNLGFDVNVGGHGAGGPGSYLGEQDFSARQRGGGPHWDVPGLEAYHGEDVFLTEALAIEARAALEDAVAEGLPFFLHFAPYAVHAPITANRRYLDHYPDLDEREAAYATMVETMDAALGVVLDALEDLDVVDDTLVVFTSDNGGLSAHGRGGQRHSHNAPLRSGKGSAYEGGVRVPTVIAWSGVSEGGALSREPIVSHDLFPTLLSAAGVRIPAWYAPLVEGRDLAPLLAGQPATWGERALFWHQPHRWGADGPGIWPFSAVRRGRWKLVYAHAERRIELYDLVADLSETTDLASREPEVVAALAQELSCWIETTGARMSIDKGSGEPVELPSEVLAERR